MEQKKLIKILSIIVGIIFIWSLINPKDYFVWFLEVLPGIIGVVILTLTYKRFKFTNIVYIFVAMHFIILIIGGHYTYAENPLFEWIKQLLNLSRNNYDRLGHLAQGFFPALIIRELLLRKTKLEKGKVLFLIIVAIILAISATYEFFEWGVAITSEPGTGNAFLATQGDIWDTQWDMLLAAIGSIISLIIFGSYHNKLLKRIK